MFPSNLKGGIALGLFTISTLTSPVNAAAECTREALLATAEKYVAAQNSGKLDDLQKLFTMNNFTYQENNQITDIAKGALGKALKVEYSRSTADTVACASYTELVALTPTPHVIATQIRHSLGIETITMVDSIVATTGALFFNASATLGYFKKVNTFAYVTHFPASFPFDGGVIIIATSTFKDRLLTRNVTGKLARPRTLGPSVARHTPKRHRRVP